MIIMKTKGILSSVLLSLLVLLGTMAIAQPKDGNRGQGNKAQKGKKDKMACLNLTEDQQAQAKTFNLEMKEEMTPLKLDIIEKKAQLNKLMIVDQPNEKEIYAMVDEISEMQAQMQKLKIDNQLKLRAILDADQKVLFDANQTGKRKDKARNGRNQADCRR